ncbi:MAG: rod shape-determining protein MreD [Nitrospinae bacterium]|nr:rod shape-determining protein MreD [Nitrospinota bacterium]
MISLLASVVFFALFILQTSLFGMIGGSAPDAMLLASIYFGMRFNRYPGLQAGILAGLLQDAASHGLLGVNLLSKGVCGLFSGWMSENHFVDWREVVTWIILIVVGTGLDQFISDEYMSNFFGAQLYFWPEAGKWLWQTFVNLFAGMLVFSFLARMESRTAKIPGQNPLFRRS